MKSSRISLEILMKRKAGAYKLQQEGEKYEDYSNNNSINGRQYTESCE